MESAEEIMGMEEKRKEKELIIPHIEKTQGEAERKGANHSVSRETPGRSGKKSG